MRHSTKDLRSLLPQEKRALLADLLQKKLGVPGSGHRPLQEEPVLLDAFAASVTDLDIHAQLDSSICPEAVPFDRVDEPRHIFMTGATGFLGAFILHDLLQQTDATISCLVRCSNSEEGQLKILGNLKAYGLQNAYDQTRITAIPGDLAQPLLGLSLSDFAALAGTVDTIYHNGAMVNWIYPFERLKPANVQGTHEVIRLASQSKAKSIHFVSSLSVFPILGDNANMIIREQDPLDHGGMLYGGYMQSKWVAEKLIARARARGLPVCIYRPGLITGHSQTGACNTKDFICQWLKSWVEMGYAPNLNTTLDMTPVDYVSRAIVYLSLSHQSLGRVFHIANPQPIHLRTLSQWMQSAGYPVEPIPYDRWRTELLNFSAHIEQGAGYALLPLFSLEESAKLLGIPQFDSHNTLDGLTGSAITCPPADSQLLETYFAYFVRSKFIEQPAWREITI